MQQKQSVLNYLSKGFSLANHSLDIYLISATLVLISSTNFPNLPSPFGTILSILTFTFLFIWIGYELSIPSFLQQKQKESKLNLKSVYETTIKNTKRIFIPGILLIILLMGSLFAYVIIALLQGSNPDQITASIQQPSEFIISGFTGGWSPVIIAFSLISSVIFSFFTFTSIFFSIENKGIFRSIVQSVVLSSRHLHYISIIILVNLITSLIFKLFPIEQTWGRMLTSALTQYVNLVITASSLLYYRAVESTLHTFQS